MTEDITITGGDMSKWKWYKEEFSKLTGFTLKIEVERKGYDSINQHLHNDINDFKIYLDGNIKAVLHNCSFDVLDVCLLGMKRMAEALRE